MGARERGKEISNAIGEAADRNPSDSELVLPL
jgi:hypothetical protein